MLVVINAQSTPTQIPAICGHIEQLGFRAYPLPGIQRTGNRNLSRGIHAATVAG